MLDQAVEGDRQAFDELARRYRPHMVARARVIVGPSDAEDVVQTALVSAFGALEGGTKPDSFVAWLSTITRNGAISHKRALRPEPIEAEAHARGADDVAIERDEVRRMTVAINELPATERSALIMRELEGRGHLEIAASEGISVGAARMAIHRARVRVRRATAAALIPLPFLLAPFRWIGSRAPNFRVTGAAAAAAAAGVAAVAIATGGGGGSESGIAGEPAGSNSGPPGGAMASASATGEELRGGQNGKSKRPHQARGGRNDGDASAKAAPSSTTASATPPAPTSASTAAPAPAAQEPAPAPEVSMDDSSETGPAPTQPDQPTPPESGDEPQPEPPTVPPPAPPQVQQPPAAPPPPPEPPPSTPTAACNGLVPCVLDLVDGVLGGGR